MDLIRARAQVGIGVAAAIAVMAAAGSWSHVTVNAAGMTAMRCDSDGDSDVDQADLLAIRGASGQFASSPSDPRDGNGDGRINVADLRYCQLRQAPATVRINEVESNGGVPGDWVELYNAAPQPLDLTGWRILDNDDQHVALPLPAGSVIPAGGYLVVEETTLGFGLGGADSVRLYNATGAPVETYNWLQHAPTTYGRCPNGTGAFQVTAVSTKNAQNDCSIVIRINEVESSSGVPGDWIELFNPGPGSANLAGFVVKDNDNTHAYTIPAGTVVPPGGYLVVEEASLGFGLGGADSARVFDALGGLRDTYSWSAHAGTTYGRCPNGTGAFAVTSAPTKGAGNSCGVRLDTVKVNEVESSGGTPGDWVELYNTGSSPVDISGLVFRDNNDSNGYTIPAGTTIAAGGFYVLDEAAFGFGLGGADSARLFDQSNTLLDAYTWAAHAGTTYGRCADGTGDFTATVGATKGSTNSCSGSGGTNTWPGGATVQNADVANTFGSNMSGLMYEGSSSSAPGVLWAVRNGPGSVFRLVWNGSAWVPDTGNDWSAGKALLYPDGTGNPDAEGVTFAENGSLGGVYVATERNNSANGISRNSVLRFDVVAGGTSLTAVREWNLTGDLPVVGPNLGMEAITWVPDDFLVAGGFLDERTGLPYAPALYPSHGTGLFFVGLEANGVVLAYALNDDGTFARIATVASGFVGVMELQFDRELGELWVVCDDGCTGRSAIFTIDSTTHKFTVARVYERPTGLDNLNNEGFAFAPLVECVADRRPAIWSDDGQTGGHALRQGTVGCTPVP